MIIRDICEFLSQHLLYPLCLAPTVSSPPHDKKSLLYEKSTHEDHVTHSPHTLLVTEIVSVDIDIAEFATKMSEPSRDLEFDAIAIISSDVDEIFFQLRMKE